MSRREPRRTGKGRDPAGATRQAGREPAGRPRKKRGPAPLLVLAVAIVGGILILTFAHPPRRRPGTANDDPAANLDLQTATRVGLDLMQGGRYIESLPFFRRQLELVPRLFPQYVWAAHLSFGSALHNGAMQVRSVRGIVVPAGSGTWRRTRMAQEGFLELSAAEALVPGPVERARVLSTRGNLLGVWGFPWDALLDFQQARAAVPNSTLVVRRLRDYQSILERPDLATPGTEP